MIQTYFLNLMDAEGNFPVCSEYISTDLFTASKNSLLASFLGYWVIESSVSSPFLMVCFVYLELFLYDP